MFFFCFFFFCFFFKCVFDLRLFGIVYFLFLLLSGWGGGGGRGDGVYWAGCGLLLWHSLVFSLTFFYDVSSLRRMNFSEICHIFDSRALYERKYTFLVAGVRLF